MSPDPFEKRKRPSFPLGHKVKRAMWNVTWLLLASWTPSKWNRWRCFLLVLFGAKLHRSAHVRGSARVWYPPNLEMRERTMISDGVNCYNMAPVRIYRDTLVSQRTHICAGTHDYTLASHPLVVRPIEIGPCAWVAAEAFLSPGCKVAEGCVIGARAVVAGTLEPWKVYSGNPARVIKHRDYDADS